MVRTRRLFLLALTVLVAGVGIVYQQRRAALVASGTAAPPGIKPGLQASSSDWVWRKQDGDCPLAELRARDFEQVEEPESKIHLKGVQLQLFHECGAKYDLVRSESAVADTGAGTLESEGEVEITLAVPASGEKGRLLAIRSSGVSIEIATGKVKTDRAVRFTFDLGDGEATGARYDPQSRELELVSSVRLHWKGNRPDSKPMNVEAGHLVYKETESKVYLSPWSKLTRENLVLEGADAVVTLEEGAIRLVETRVARGTDRYPARRLAFGAEELVMRLDTSSHIEKITGAKQARLDSESASGRTEVTTDHIDLDFAVTAGESILTRAMATGKATVKSHPAKRGSVAPNARVIRSEAVLATMRPGGEDVESIETRAPGTLELVPGDARQARREMTAERMWLTFLGGNQIDKLRAVTVATRTHKPPRAERKGEEVAPAETWSRDLLAHFDEVTGEMTQLEQWNEFRYKEGAREATAAHARLESRTDRITLERSGTGAQARTWDAAGSVTGDRIVLNQETGDFTAEGKVASTRKPEKKGGGGGMLSEELPMQATAARMVTSEGNQRVVYETDAVLWQGGNRLQAERVLINRKDRTLEAEGSVVSVLLDGKGQARTKRAVHTIVRAAKLHYNDGERLALYEGGARMIRDAMDVKSETLRAWLSEGETKTPGQSSLERAFADGNVEIDHAEAGRVRRGRAEHGEYYVADERVVLNGGIAQLMDSKKGTTRGRQLTWYSGNDTLHVVGGITQPAVSRIRRK